MAQEDTAMVDLVMPSGSPALAAERASHHES
jgi:hypothetical protein